MPSFTVGQKVRIKQQVSTFHPSTPGNLVRLEAGEVRTVTSISGKPRIPMPPRFARALGNERGIGLDNYAPTVMAAALEPA